MITKRIKPFTKEERMSKGIPQDTDVEGILELLYNKTKKERDVITKAYNFTKEAHKGQKRYSGRDYFEHPYETARYLASIGMSADVIAAGLMHDVVEDTDTTADEIEKEFGKNIRQLVEGVTKLGTLRYHGMVRYVESLRKLFAATAKDVRVIIIKVMDRRHNAMTLLNVPKHKRKRIALETIEIYAALAGRLGMGIIKKDLEDFAFPHAYPKEYKKTYKLFKEAGGENEKDFNKRLKSIQKKLYEYGIKKFKTDYRVKGLYSLYKKLERKDWHISKIYDIWALRLITQDISDCYTILGVLHAEWQPLPGRLKDYIACPKPNGYKSIHTTILTGDGNILEIQIRTEDMHREAQFGIASHFSYKEKNNNGSLGAGLKWIQNFIPGRLSYDNSNNRNINKNTYAHTKAPEWIRHMAEARRQESPEEYLEEIKSDFFAHRIFVFTPTGDVIDLPLGATPIDFAYSIHSDVGDHLASVKINGKMSSIDTELQNGDYVDVTTSKKSHPTNKWLQYAKTSLAKRKIRSYLQNNKGN